MNNILRLFVSIYLFTFFTISIAMQKIRFREITDKTSYSTVQYVGPNTVAMHSAIKFCILDLPTGKYKDKNYEDGQILNRNTAIIQYEGKKIFLANGPKLMIIDRKEKTYNSFDCLPITSLKTGSSNDIWLTTENGYVLRYDYNENKLSKEKIKGRHILDFDKEEETIYVEDHEGDIYIYNVNTYEYKTIEIPKRNYKEVKNLKRQLSPDRSYLAFSNESFIYKATINENSSCEPFIESLPFEQLKRMAFLPHQNILATISQISDTQSIMQYWDFEQAKAHDPLCEFEFDAIDCRDISFAPNGMEVIIAFLGKCIRSSVPVF